ncbi:MBL fold metallo-hydrolase [Anaeromicropila populeti]|uniref:Competence protein ComEC n=1 Tax=Anaeromicropila populeti TaxID=37658 RepID=A0A1I6LWQ6_9FIRM|nr:MBL fold metallo-hydrolase [Anaeromicropila populeti]SFS07907.1 competence protein ComEC [Anaeromicropila populeti]
MKRLNHSLKSFLIMLLAMIISISGVSGINSTSLLAATNLKVHFIDCGQGDAILFQYGSSNVLLDTGTESEYKSKVEPYISDLGISKITSLIVSHPDADHMGGADLAIEDFNIQKVYMTTYENSTMEYKELIAAIETNQVKRVNVKKGSSISIGRLKAKVFAADSKADDANASSIVFKLVHKKKSFLFTGDATAEVENTVKKNYNINVDVLKVSHHGSSSASPIAYLKEASPKYSIISVGKDNDYGHPNKYVVNRLEKYSDNVLRTDEAGTIVITSNGTKLTCSTVKDTDSSKDSVQEKKTGSIIGNVNSKVYHEKGCSSLPAEKNRIYFDSAEEAEEAGYRACKRCH